LQEIAARKWQGDPAAQRAGVFARAAAEIQRQQGEREVLARWIAEACGVLFSVEKEAEDAGESLRMLRERGLRLVRAVLQPTGPNAELTGPQGR
jgi:acyl-CoA reductase-like NAD-dependent aldehyde dehydrogenase